MADKITFALLLVNWVVAFAYFAPTALTGRRFLYKRPRFGLVIWLGLFLVSILAFAGALAIACYSIFETWTSLQATHIGSDRWFEAMAVSFSPWIVLAFAGIVTALANQKLEGLFDRSNRVSPGMLGSKRVGTFHGFEILELPLEIAYVGSSSADKSIVQTTGAVTVLGAGELAACHQHEAAHLRAHHGWILSGMALVGQTLGAFAVTRALTTEISILIELIADSKVTDKKALLSALSKLGGSLRETRIRKEFLGE